MSRSVSDEADKPGKMTPAPGGDLSEGPDTDAFVVRAASAPERHFLSSRFRFLATTVETAGRYSFLAVDIPVGGGPRPHVHQEADEWFYVLEGDLVFHVDDRAFTLAEGDFVHIPMGTTHWFEVLDAPIKVLAGYCPAGEELRFLQDRRDRPSTPTPERTAASEVRQRSCDDRLHPMVMFIKINMGPRTRRGQPQSSPHLAGQEWSSQSADRQHQLTGPLGHHGAAR